MAEVGFRVLRPLPPKYPETLTILGQPIDTIAISESTFKVNLPSGVTSKQLISALELVWGITVTQIATGSEVRQVNNLEVLQEIDRLMMEQEKESGWLETGGGDVPVVKGGHKPVKIWDTIFRKPEPVNSLALWQQSLEAERYVYLPNDLQKPLESQEHCLSNAMYTQVMLNAYKRLCRKTGVWPSIKLKNGATEQVRDLLPIHGTQPEVQGERSARLADSKLIGYDDTPLAHQFIDCVAELGSDEYERESVRIRVMSKIELMLLGQTRQTPNQTVIRNIYHALIDHASDKDPWATRRPQFVSAVLAILRQMVLEDKILADNRELFIIKLSSLGYSAYVDRMASIFDESRVPHAKVS